MACLVVLLLLLAMAGHSSAAWCVCKDMDTTILQKNLDYACGAGADCNPTHQNGLCYNPNTVRAHCNYAVNSYFQKYRQQLTACDFSGTASIVNADPSTNGCIYPATPSSTTTITTPMTPPTTGTGIGTPSTNLPNSPPLTGVGTKGGETNPLLGPSGVNTDTSDGGVRLPTSILLCSSIIFTFSALSLLVRA